MLSLLAIKGLITLLATKGVAILAVKSALAFGVALTIKSLLVAGVVVGGVQWTQKRVKYIEKLINALEKGDSQEAITNMALLANSLYGTDLQNINLLPADIDEYLVHIGVDSNARLAIKDYIQDNLHHIREL
ncbi:hypothetical protein [Moraxella boevrei]|uniref:hypothetical protein n=1 Tax=Faucicola boevrei TaxID=346665 RepID=UPI003736215A